MKNYLLTVVLLLTVSLTLGGQSRERESIDLGSLRVYLGEAKLDTLAALAGAGYTVNPISEGRNRFAVYRESLVANLSFSDDRLTFIDKDWNPDESSGYELAKAIFFAVKSLSERGCRSVQLSTESSDQKGLQVRNAILECEGTHRRFEITAVDAGSAQPGGKQQTVSLSEILQVKK